jgi:TolB-like protein/Flp pilus assembly protein TadD
MIQRTQFTGLGRRNVPRAGAFYVAAVWALAQGISQLGPAVGLPDWTTRWFLVAAAVGFPFWLAFAWYYEFTPEGLKRESEIDPADSITAHTGKTLDRWIFGIMAVAIVLLLTNTFVWHKGAGLNGDTEGEPIPAQSIAVMPFANLSSDKEQEYFADGISEDLLNLLAKAQPLQVAARTSSFSFKGKQAGIAEIAKTLRVANVLEGSVQKAGDAVRVTAQLVRASDGYEIWSQRYDRKLDDIFAIQDGIAADVVSQLKVKLLGAVPTVRETDPKAYALYLQARQLGRKFDANAFRQSDELYRKVLAIDPRYAPAWDSLCTNLINETVVGLLSNDDGMRQAREAVEQALAIDPDYAPAHASLGSIALYQGDLAGAAGHFERALALDPTDLSVVGNASVLLYSLGRLKEAIPINEFILTRDPVNVNYMSTLGYNYIRAGRFDEAIAKLQKVLSLRPGRGSANFQLGVALLFKGDAAAALVQMQQESSEPVRLLGLAMAYHALGKKADADAALTQVMEKYNKDYPYNIAFVHSYCGDADKAFEWLDKAVAYADPGLSEIPVEKLFDNIRSDPRWLPFLRKIGKAPEQLAKIEFKVTLPQAEGATTSGGTHP